MLVPISWLKEFVDIKLSLKDLMWKITEAGLTCESYKKIGDDTVLDIEVTANRPDFMSIIGVARELAAIQGIKIKEPKIQKLLSPKDKLPIYINNDFELCPRFSAITIKGVEQKPSPKWMQERLIAVGLRPINNLVDITNYVMFELGNPIHVFDYDKIVNAKMSILRSSGGEKFVSVDDKPYVLPQNAIIFKSGGQVIDLCGIKGGENSGVSKDTTNVLVLVAIYNGTLIRRTSQKMGLSSEASRIFERGANVGGTVDTLKRTTNLMLKLAGGAVSSEILDVKQQELKSRKIGLSLIKLENVLGLKIPDKDVRTILYRLNLSPNITKDGIVCTIPTYRGDIKLEEDLIEEVARIYGYNRFPKTLPVGSINVSSVPYSFDDSFQKKLRELLIAAGYSQVMTLSLISKELIKYCLLETRNFIKISNPVSSEYEYMRISLIPSLIVATKINQDNPLKIFELDKIFSGMQGKIQEPYRLSGIARGVSFREFKGVIDLLVERLNPKNVKTVFEAPNTYWHPNKSATLSIGNQIFGYFGEIHPETLTSLGIKEKLFSFELDTSVLEKSSQQITFNPVPEYPAQIEDLTLTLSPKTRIGDLIQFIKVADKTVSDVELQDSYKDSYTFRIWYQSLEKTLDNAEIEIVRNNIIKIVNQKFGATVK